MLSQPIKQIGRRIPSPQLDLLQMNLLDAASKASANAFCPSSGFCVGAALWIPKKEIVIVGANYESASFGGTICAERAAIFTANSLGYHDFTHLAITTQFKNGNPTSHASAPCGLCRQLIYDAADRVGHDIEIITSSTGHRDVIVSSIYEMLPMPFAASDFGVDLEKFRR